MSRLSSLVASFLFLQQSSLSFAFTENISNLTDRESVRTLVTQPVNQMVSSAPETISFVLPTGENTGSSSIEFQTLGNRVYRALIHIDKPSDPERFEFEVVGASSLEKQVDGSVLILGENREVFAAIAPPWAKDEQDRQVPTYFETNGTILTQVVSHQDKNFQYGITADPFWVPFAMLVARCMAHPVCRHIVQDRGVHAGVSWALRHLF